MWQLFSDYERSALCPIYIYIYIYIYKRSTLSDLILEPGQTKQQPAQKVEVKEHVNLQSDVGGGQVWAASWLALSNVLNNRCFPAWMVYVFAGKYDYDYDLAIDVRRSYRVLTYNIMLSLYSVLDYSIVFYMKVVQYFSLKLFFALSLAVWLFKALNTHHSKILHPLFFMC